MSDNTIRIKESVQELDDRAAAESSRSKLNRLAVLKLYALFVRSGETEPVPAIARSVGVAEDTVRKWLETYSQSGISGLLSGKGSVGASKRRKHTSQEVREQPPEDTDRSIASVPAVESVEDDAGNQVDAEVAAIEDALGGESARVTDQSEIDAGHSIVVGSVAERYRLLFDEIEDDDQADCDPSEETSRLAATQSSSFKDELRLRARAGRRAIGRATKRLFRKGDAAHAHKRITRSEESLLPKKDPTTAFTETPVEGGTGTSLAESVSNAERAVPAVPSTFDSEPFAQDKRIDQSADDLNGAWVLVAETDDMIASVIRHRLEKQGANVVVAPDGMEVVSTLWRRDFDLLVAAVALPGLDGFEITRWVRESARHTRIPVMVMSWPGNESDLVRAFDAGADDFMYKPFSPVELITRLKRLRRRAATGGGTTAASDAA